MFNKGWDTGALERQDWANMFIRIYTTPWEYASRVTPLKASIVNRCGSAGIKSTSVEIS